MSFKPYRFAADCPNCGQKDKEGMWMGARMSSTRWGHDHACCSESCGIAFAKSPKRFAMDRAALLQKRAVIDQQLESLAGREAKARSKKGGQ